MKKNDNCVPVKKNVFAGVEKTCSLGCGEKRCGVDAPVRRSSVAPFFMKVHNTMKLNGISYIIASPFDGEDKG